MNLIHAYDRPNFILHPSSFIIRELITKLVLTIQRTAILFASYLKSAKPKYLFKIESVDLRLGIDCGGE